MQSSRRMCTSALRNLSHRRPVSRSNIPQLSQPLVTSSHTYIPPRENTGLNVRINVNRYMSSDKRSSGIFGDILRKEEEQAKEDRAAAKAAEEKESEPEPIVMSEPEPIVMSEPEPIVMSEPEPIVMSGDVDGVDEGDSDISKPPDGGVDQDLWEVLCAVTTNPFEVSECLAENMVFSLEDCVDMPNYRLGTFGVDDKNRRALGRWISKNGGPEFEEEDDEEEVVAEQGEEEVGKEEGAETAQKEKPEEPPTPPFDWQGLINRAPSYAASAWDDVKLSLGELFTIEKDESVLKKRVHNPMRPQTSDDSGEEAAAEPATGSAIMVVKEGESAWKRLTSRMSEAPLFQELLRRAREAKGSEIGKEASKAQDQLSDKVEDAREAWETSQNPWVYRVSEVWDSLTHETDTAIVIKELRRLEPNFSLEVWRDNMQEVMVPTLLSAWLRGDTITLREWCKSDVMEKLSADIAIRKKERVVIDPNVLSVDDSETIVNSDMMNERGALIGLHVSAQQIHCVRNHEGEIIEGGEDHIKKYGYFMVFQREYTPEEGELRWMLADFAAVGDQDVMI